MKARRISAASGYQSGSLSGRSRTNYEGVDFYPAEELFLAVARQLNILLPRDKESA